MTSQEFKEQAMRLLAHPKFQVIKPSKETLNKVFTFNKHRDIKWFRDLVDYFCVAFSEYHIWKYDDFKVEDPEYKLWIVQQKNNGVDVSQLEQNDTPNLDFVIDDSSSVGRFLKATGVNTMSEAMDVFRKRRESGQKDESQ